MDLSDNMGIVFDIQRASLHDGPGIRTTVFLKGCSLHCVWCHNPEANDFKQQLSFNSEKCILCGSCEAVCDYGVHHIVDSLHNIDYDKCVACGRCVQACNQQALKIVGRKMAVAEVMQVVLADRAFYMQSGGGLTLSGGEPMAQFAFTFDLLKTAKAQSIHTCIETSGFSSRALYEKILPYSDLFLIDYKITGSTAHKQYTGVANESIGSNLNFLYQQHKPIILRCPIIPGINDTRLHFQAIAELNSTYPELSGIEILPYHDMGNSKRTSIGASPTLVGLKSTPPELATQWINTLHGYGCLKAQIG